MVDVQTYKDFLKSLLENYSLPHNLNEDIRSLVYQEQMTNYDNNNDFIA